MASEIKHEDVVQVVLQFLQENKYTKTFEALEKEANVHLNLLSEPEYFKSAFMQNRWEKVIEYLQTIHLPSWLFMDFMELVLSDLFEKNEYDLAKVLLDDFLGDPTTFEGCFDRVKRLQLFINAKKFAVKELFGEKVSKEKFKEKTLDAILKVTRTAQPNRLLSLVGQALQLQAQLNPSIAKKTHKFDLLAGKVIAKPEKEERLLSKVSKEIDLSNLQSKVETVCFSPNGEHLYLGLQSGRIKPWDAQLLSCDPSLPYEEIIHSNQGICALGVNEKSEFLCSADISGLIKVTRLSDAKELRKMESGFRDQIRGLLFNKDTSQVIAFSRGIRVFGLQTGKLVKAIHERPNDPTSGPIINWLGLAEGNRAYFGADDGKLTKIDLKTSEVLLVLRPPSHQGNARINFPIGQCLQLPNGHISLTNNTNRVFLINHSGAFFGTLTGETEKELSFEFLTRSFGSKFIYAAGRTGAICKFDAENREFLGVIGHSEAEISGILHSPIKNQMIVWDSAGKITICT